MKIASYCNRIIEFSFYALFALVPIVFDGSTSELFELNKMWLTFGLTIFIAVAWFGKMIAVRQFRVQRTPLDIFLGVFLLSQLISTLVSLDSHVSFWGYYSRFNGGLLSLLCYGFLYYAFVTNFTVKKTLRLLYVTLLSGLFVSLWGLPSHFGKDPTCLWFRGTLDVSCWTEAFQPTIRMFSTLGQPAWLAAYMAVLIPVAAAMTIYQFFHNIPEHESLTGTNVLHIFGKNSKRYLPFFILVVLFYACLLYANTRAGFYGFWLAYIFFAVAIFLISTIKRYFSVGQYMLAFTVLTLSLFVLNFFIGAPVSQLYKFSYPGLFPPKVAQEAKPTETAASVETQTQPEAGNPDITDSGEIRLFVWEGAIDAWKSNALIGTGVETFAFAYYQHRPLGHNLTSEWDFLYNKAHNEYLNYLATTGLLGLGSYLVMIAAFFWFSWKIITRDVKEKEKVLYIIGLLAGYVSLLVTNFFGFSVVIINLFLFLIPAFVFVFADVLKHDFVFAFPKEQTKSAADHVTLSRWVGIGAVTLVGLLLLYVLWQDWEADKKYALGFNLARSGEYQAAYNPLMEAYAKRPSEPVIKDELSAVSSQVAMQFLQQQQATEGAKFAQQAIELNNDVLTSHPNNLTFWKTRIRIFYGLGQYDVQYMQYALQAAIQAAKLAPTDAKIAYNLGVLYGQTGDMEKATTVLRRTIQLKPDYEDAYYALALFYHDMSLDKDGKVANASMEEKAEQTLEYVLKELNPNNEQIKRTLKQWQGE